MEERLQKLLAQAGLCSRREAERWITDGRVTVNGRTASVGDKADLRRDKIMVDGRPLGGSEEKRRRARTARHVSAWVISLRTGRRKVSAR